MALQRTTSLPVQYRFNEPHEADKTWRAARLGRGERPAVMAPCALRPDISPADSGNVLFGAGAVGGEGNVQHSSQVCSAGGDKLREVDVVNVKSRVSRPQQPPCCPQDCWATCKSDPRCASWWWCDERDGCTDEDGRRLPHKGCELRRETVVRRLGQPPPDWHLPTFAAGFMKRETRPHAACLREVQPS